MTMVCFCFVSFTLIPCAVLLVILYVTLIIRIQCLCSWLLYDCRDVILLYSEVHIVMYIADL